MPFLLVALGAVAAAFALLLFVRGRASSSAEAPAAQGGPAPPRAARPSARPATRPATPPLPPGLARALAGNRVVVLSVFSPNAAADRLVNAEARAGAQLAGVGFVAVPTTNAEAAARLYELSEVLESPTVLFLRGRVEKNRFVGYSDRELIAQAAENTAR